MDNFIEVEDSDTDPELDYAIGVDLLEQEDEADELEEEFEELESGEVVNVRHFGRPKGYIARQAIIMINDYLRVRISENSISMHLEKKTKNEATDVWVNCGYFCEFDKLLDYVADVCTKERILTKQIKDYKELKDLFKSIKTDMMGYGKLIKEQVANNTYLTDIMD